MKEALGVEVMEESYVVDMVGKLVALGLRELEDEIKIMRNKSKLKNEREKIFIEDDLRTQSG